MSGESRFLSNVREIYFTFFGNANTFKEKYKTCVN